MTTPNQPESTPRNTPTDQEHKPGVGQPGRGGENLSGNQPPKTDSRHARAGERRSKYGNRPDQADPGTPGTPETSPGPSTSAGPGSEGLGGPTPT